MNSSHMLTRSTRLLLQRSSTIRTTQFLRPTFTLYTKATSIINTNTHNSASFRRPLSTTTSIRKGLQPDTSDPTPPNVESTTGTSYDDSPADLTDSEYHEISDQYLNTLQLVLEEKAEQDGKTEVEYSAGVLTITVPDKGTYVINKQPPNKQIWLSSPISGPKRFNWVMMAGEGQEVKEGTETSVGDDGQMGGGKWVYLKDGTTMTELLRKEIDVVVAPEGEGDATTGREGPGGSG